MSDIGVNCVKLHFTSTSVGHPPPLVTLLVNVRTAYLDENNNPKTQDHLVLAEYNDKYGKYFYFATGDEIPLDGHAKATHWAVIPKCIDNLV